MGFDSLKGIYEKLPNKVKFMLMPLFVRTITDNGVFKATIKELDKFDRLDEKKQSELQFNELKEILLYAGQHVPFYKDIFDDCEFNPATINSAADIEKLPLLTKEAVIKAGDRIFSDEEMEFYTTFTGGSSGKSMKCLMEKNSYYKERAFFTHFLAPYGYDPKKSRTVSFYGHNKGKDYYFSPVKGDIVISPFRLFKEECFEDIFRLIESFKPDFITCYASAVTYFARQCAKYGKELRLKAVVFTSENWTDEQEKLVTEVFNCPVVSTYGHTERAVFGTIKDGMCDFHKLYGYTELIPTDAEDEFQIVCTGFINRKMPLIRYVTDDVVQVEKNGAYKLIGHKKSDVFLIGKNGAKIFKGAMTLHIAEASKIGTYQYVQNEKGRVELHVVQDEILSDKDLKKISDYVTERCEGLLDIDIKLVPEVKLTSRGKYIWAICNIEN